MDLRKLQRVIVDALEDVKAQDIQVFNTQGITDLFDRVVLATGTSNRQTRALASHVADEVKKAGGHVVSVEGEETGEWLLVDVGDAVVHVMQPAIRSYYNLEEIWGAKPVKIKLGGGKPGPFAQATEDASAGDDDVPAPSARRSSRRVAMAQAADAEAMATLRKREAKAAMKAEAAQAEAAEGGRAGAKRPAAKKPGARKAGAKAPAGPRTAVAQSAAAKAPARKAPARSLTALRSADDGDVPVRRSRLRSGQ